MTTAWYRCCQPRRLLTVAGFLLLAALVVWYAFWGRQLQVRAEAWLNEGSGQTLITIVDVFSCCILTWKALTVMLPAFILAGAISAFAPTSVVLRYLGDRTHKATAYGTAALSGMVLSLCSCNVVPLFMSILRRGAGLGPAFTFLLAGPAINVVAAIFTIQVIGWRLGLWRLIGVPVLAIIVGGIMSGLFGRRQGAAPDPATVQLAEDTASHARLWPLFLLLLVLVVYGSWDGMSWPVKTAGMVPLVVMLLGWLAWKFDRDEHRELARETWGHIKLVVPILLPAVILIGALAAFIDVKLVYRLVGDPAEGAGFWAHLRPLVLGATFGDLMYFPILTEVAFTKAFLKLGMGVGPALAILLTGPGTSLPGLIIIARAIGWKKALTFEALYILVAIAYSYLFASKIGEYICSCMMAH